MVSSLTTMRPLPGLTFLLESFGLPPRQSGRGGALAAMDAGWCGLISWQ